MKKKSIKLNLNSQELAFFKFIYQRQLIWYKRFILNQQPPWTNDLILQKYKIINVYRELDRCTLYLLDKLKNINNRPAQLLNIVFFRFFNQDKLYEKLELKPFKSLDDFKLNQLIQAFDKIKQDGFNLFNTAYIISPGNSSELKHLTVLKNINQSLKNFDELICKIDLAKTPRESLNILTELPQVGPFLACEFWTDLTYINFFKQHWTDNDFVNIGPGADWALQIIYPDDKNREAKLERLYNIQFKILPTIHQYFPGQSQWQTITYKQAFSNHPYLSITNIESGLCEFRKYWNIRQGKGRRKYFKPKI